MSTHPLLVEAVAFRGEDGPEASYLRVVSGVRRAARSLGWNKSRLLQLHFAGAHYPWQVDFASQVTDALSVEGLCVAHVSLNGSTVPEHFTTETQLGEGHTFWYVSPKVHACSHEFGCRCSEIMACGAPVNVTVALCGIWDAELRASRKYGRKVVVCMPVPGALDDGALDVEGLRNLTYKRSQTPRGYLVEFNTDDEHWWSYDLACYFHSRLTLSAMSYRYRVQASGIGSDGYAVWTLTDGATPDFTHEQRSIATRVVAKLGLQPVEADIQRNIRDLMVQAKMEFSDAVVLWRETLHELQTQRAELCADTLYAHVDLLSDKVAAFMNLAQGAVTCVVVGTTLFFVLPTGVLSVLSLCAAMIPAGALALGAVLVGSKIGWRNVLSVLRNASWKFHLDGFLRLFGMAGWHFARAVVGADPAPYPVR